jgi:hypothetical protein
MSIAESESKLNRDPAEAGKPPAASSRFVERGELKLSGFRAV